MKKPLLSLRTPRDVACLLVCLALSVGALALFFLPEKSVAASAGTGINTAPKSFYGLVERIAE